MVDYRARKKDRSLYLEALMLAGNKISVKDVVTRIRYVLRFFETSDFKDISCSPWERVLEPIFNRVIGKCWNSRVEFIYRRVGFHTEPGEKRKWNDKEYWAWRLHGSKGNHCEAEVEETVADAWIRMDDKCYYWMEQDEVGFTSLDAYKFTEKDRRLLEGQTEDRPSPTEAIMRIRFVTIQLLKQLHEGQSTLTYNLGPDIHQLELYRRFMSKCWPKWKIGKKGSDLVVRPDRGFMNYLRQRF